MMYSDYKAPVAQIPAPAAVAPPGEHRIQEFVDWDVYWNTLMLLDDLLTLF